MPPPTYDPPVTVYAVVAKGESGTVDAKPTRAEAQASADRHNREWRATTPWIVRLMLWPWHRGVLYVVRAKVEVRPTAAWEAAYEEWMEPGVGP